MVASDGSFFSYRPEGGRMNPVGCPISAHLPNPTYRSRAND